MVALLGLAACSSPPRSTVDDPGSAPAPPPERSPRILVDANPALEFARARIGSPYQWGGTGAGGFDCSGLVQLAFTRAGVRLPRTTSDQARYGLRVPRQHIRPGDLVFFGRGPGSIDHVGIASGNGRFVHASSSRGVVEDPLDMDYFHRRYVFARRVTTSAASH